MRSLRLRYLAPLVLWLCVAALVSLLEGTPQPLPTVALGSTALLHALRAAALFAIGLVAAMVLAHAGAGRLPAQLSTSGIVYDTREFLKAKRRSPSSSIKWMTTRDCSPAPRHDWTPSSGGPNLEAIWPATARKRPANPA